MPEALALFFLFCQNRRRNIRHYSHTPIKSFTIFFTRKGSAYSMSASPFRLFDILNIRADLTIIRKVSTSLRLLPTRYLSRNYDDGKHYWLKFCTECGCDVCGGEIKHCTKRVSKTGMKNPGRCSEGIYRGCILLINSVHMCSRSIHLCQHWEASMPSLSLSQPIQRELYSSFFIAIPADDALSAYKSFLLSYIPM